MASPDLGLAPPPPPDVSAQLRPSSGGGGAPDLATILAGLTGNAPPPMMADITPKVMELEPILAQLARQVPALGPDVDRLNVELQSRMGGLPAALSGFAGQPPAPEPMNTPMGPAPQMGGQSVPQSLPMGGLPQMPAEATGAPAGPAAPPALPQPPGTTGALDTAMQIEMKLPALGADDPTLMPYIQGFIARMREEVPKVVEGETESINPPEQKAPTDSMLSKIPVTY